MGKLLDIISMSSAFISVKARTSSKFTFRSAFHGAFEDETPLLPPARMEPVDPMQILLLQNSSRGPVPRQHSKTHRVHDRREHILALGLLLVAHRGEGMHHCLELLDNRHDTSRGSDDMSCASLPCKAARARGRALSGCKHRSKHCVQCRCMHTFIWVCVAACSQHAQTKTHPRAGACAPSLT